MLVNPLYFKEIHDMASPSTPPATPQPQVVSQEALRRYLELTPLAREFESLQKQLLAAFDSGAVAEDGDLIAHFYVTEEQQFSGRKVCEALGLTEEQARQLRAAVPPTRFRRLRVHDRRGPRTQARLACRALEEGGGDAG